MGSILCVPVNVPLLPRGAGLDWASGAGWLDSVTALKRAPTVFFPGVRVATPVIHYPASSSSLEGRHISSRIPLSRLLAEGSVMWANNFQQIEAFNTCMCFLLSLSYGIAPISE